MAEIASWALLLAGFLAIVTIIVGMPWLEAINVPALTLAVTQLVTYASEGLQVARAIINNFVPIGLRTALSAIIIYQFTKYLVLWSVKILVVAYHWIFK